MASYTSSGTGFWDLAATWGGSGPPGAGDRATIAASHIVTVRADATVGDGPAVDTPVVVVNGQLVINTGIVLTVRGDVAMSGTTGSNGVVTCAGGILIDGAFSGLKHKIGVGRQHSTTAKLVLSGSSGARASLASTGTGTTNAFVIYYYDGTAWLGAGQVEADYADFTNIGDATNIGIGWNPTNSATRNLYLRNCRFVGCGQVKTITSVGALCNLDISNSTWAGTLGTYGVYLTLAASPTGTRTFNNNRLDIPANLVPITGLNGTNNYFHNGYGATSFDPAAWQYNAVNHGGYTGGIPLMNGSSNLYHFDETASNPHSLLATATRNYTASGIIFDCPRGAVGDLLCAMGAGSSNTLSATNCVVIPTSAGIAPGELISPLNSGWTYTVDHNTVTCTGLPGGNAENGVAVYGESFAGATGMYASIRSNLVWSPTGKGSVLLRHNLGTVSNPLASPTMGDYNAFNAPIDAAGSGVQAVYGAVGGYCDTVTTVTNPMFTTTTGLGAHDVIANPNFVDTTRCLATFDTVYLGNSASAWATGTAYAVGDIRSASDAGFYGNATVNYRCILAHTSAAGNATTGQPGVAASWRTNWEFAGLYRIRSSALTYSAGTPQATPRDLWEWVRAGWAPQNTALKNTAHDGGDIGAVAVSAASIPVAGTATFVGSGPTGITFSATEATLGTAPYTKQWQRAPHGNPAWSGLTDGGGVTGSATLSLFDGSAVAGTLYDYRCKYTDNVGATAFSAAAPAAGAQLYPGGPIGAGSVGSQVSDFDGGF